jgi:hypothetical protein
MKSKSPHIFAAFVLARDAGLRDTEIKTLTWAQIDLKAKFLRVKRAKTEAGEGRTIPLNAELYDALLHYRAWYEERFGKAQDEWYLFAFGRPMPFDPTRHVTSLKTAWKSIRKNANVKGRWHDNRHTLITELAETGAYRVGHCHFARSGHRQRPDGHGHRGALLYGLCRGEFRLGGCQLLFRLLLLCHQRAHLSGLLRAELLNLLAARFVELRQLVVDLGDQPLLLLVVPVGSRPHEFARSQAGRDVALFSPSATRTSLIDSWNAGKFSSSAAAVAMYSSSSGLRCANQSAAAGVGLS